MAESFFATLEAELLNLRTFDTYAEARLRFSNFSKGDTSGSVGTVFVAPYRP